jgi:hypothetical protein
VHDHGRSVPNGPSAEAQPLVVCCLSYTGRAVPPADWQGQQTRQLGGANDGRSKTSTLWVIFPPVTVKHSAAGASLTLAVCG